MNLRFPVHWGVLFSDLIFPVCQGRGILQGLYVGILITEPLLILKTVCLQLVWRGLCTWASKDWQLPLGRHSISKYYYACNLNPRIHAKCFPIAVRMTVNQLSYSSTNDGRRRPFHSLSGDLWLEDSRGRFGVRADPCNPRHGGGSARRGECNSASYGDSTGT